MPKSSKPRKKYKPKGAFADPLGYVLEGLKPVSKHDTYLLDLKIKNSQAMVALLQGTAKKKDMDTLIAMSNICEALLRLGFGTEYKEAAVEGRFAILSIVYRAVKALKFVPTGPEIKQLQTLMELHDAQMDVITINDMEKALALAKKEIRNKEAHLLPPVPELLKDYQ